jgi:hypothetical protein
MVLDLSGSMQWPMGGEGASGQSRYAILKERAESMITDFSQMGFDVYISVVVFGSNANDVWAFRNVNISEPTNQYSALISDISGLSPYEGNLASTNTGDGIRRGYYLLKNKSDELIASGSDSSDFTRHMMILVDGGTQAYTHFWDYRYMYVGAKDTGTYDVIPPYSGDYYVDYQFDSFNWWGVQTSFHGDDYVEKIGNELVQPFKYDGEQAISSFVIGFSANTSDHISLHNIGEAVQAKPFTQPDGTTKRFVVATNADDLNVAFNSFTEEVATSLWSIYGPRLR